MKTKTRTIAGQKITLLVGVRYVASRPAARRGVKRFPVTIQAAVGETPEAKSLELPPMSYDDSNKFLAAFNCGQSSFDGRVW